MTGDNNCCHINILFGTMGDVVEQRKWCVRIISCFLYLYLISLFLPPTILYSVLSKPFCCPEKKKSVKNHPFTKVDKIPDPFILFNKRRSDKNIPSPDLYTAFEQPKLTVGKIVTLDQARVNPPSNNQSLASFLLNCVSK